MKNVLLVLIGLFLASNVNGQVAAVAPIIGANVIKVNVSSSLALGHYLFQYERALSLNRSIGLGIGVSSNVDLPFKKQLLDQYGDNADAVRAIETTKFDKLTITPEYRFYLNKKGAPIGFYLATFVRYTKFSFSGDYSFTPSNGILHIAPVTGSLNGIGGGAMIGVQWALGKTITLDWWIVGPFAGVQNGDFNGTSDMSDMSDADKAKLESDIEDTDIPLWNIDATVENNTVNAKISGPFVGVRMFGICLGVRL